ncbi:MAG: hypothetical protein K6T16_00720 [Candidatus Pacearchaeota archaeon]|nr:hypothetical protein [Candidatus Pacearchaeota archaeon]
MGKGLVAIIASAVFTLASQANAQSRHFSYDFNAALLGKIPLLTGKFHYDNSSRGIQANIDSIKIEFAGTFIRDKLEDFKNTTYKTTNQGNEIVYTEEIEGKETVTKHISKNSPYSDVLTSAQRLLELIEKDSVECHQLVREGKLELIMGGSIRSVKLISFTSLDVKYHGKKVRAKILSVYGCPDEDTFFNLVIYQGKVIQIAGSSKKYPGIKVVANLRDWYIEEE